MLKSKCFVLVTMAASVCCHAQEAEQANVQTALAGSTQPTSPPFVSCCRVANGTPVVIEILDSLNSALLKRGDKFKLRLAEPLLVDGNAVLLAGMEGVGEVVHAEKSHGGGKAGELLIAARQLDGRDKPVTLRGLKLGGAGKDNSNTAIAVAIAAGPFAFFVQGREIVIPSGTLAQAKIAQDMVLEPLPPAAASAVINSQSVTDVVAPHPPPPPVSTSSTLPAAPVTSAEPQSAATTTKPNTEE